MRLSSALTISGLLALAGCGIHTSPDATPTTAITGTGAVAVTAPASAASLTVFVDRLDLSKGSQEWNTPQVNLSAEYNPMTLKERTFSHGYGTHANALLVINVKGAAKLFTAIVGIDDDATDIGDVEFLVIGDGKILKRTGTITRDDPVQNLSVDITGIQQLVLQVNDADGNIDMDHADWAEAAITLDPAKATTRPETIPASQAKLPS